MPTSGNTNQSILNLVSRILLSCFLNEHPGRRNQRDRESDQRGYNGFCNDGCVDCVTQPEVALVNHRLEDSDGNTPFRCAAPNRAATQCLQPHKDHQAFKLWTAKLFAYSSGFVGSKV